VTEEQAPEKAPGQPSQAKTAEQYETEAKGILEGMKDGAEKLRALNAEAKAQLGREFPSDPVLRRVAQVVGGLGEALSAKPAAPAEPSE
jgi:hypothetical protein